jgi:error-prone DNA polymerase
MARPPTGASAQVYEPRDAVGGGAVGGGAVGGGAGGGGAAGGMSSPSHLTRRVLVHPSGFRQSPYADLKPPGDDTAATRQAAARQEAASAERERAKPPRKLWHSSPGSSGQ